MIGFGQNKAPYVIGKSGTGIEIDIFREALSYKGHSMKIGYFPNKRLPYALRNIQKINGVAGVRQTSDDGFYYVDKYIFFENYAISKKIDQLNINKIADLKGLTIVAWQNAYQDLGTEYYNFFKPYGESHAVKTNYFEIPDQENQNAMFWAGRAKIIIVDKAIFAYYKILLGKKHNTSIDVKYHAIFSGKTYFQAAFKSRELANDFEEGLRHIQTTGRYEAIYKKYTENHFPIP